MPGDDAVTATLEHDGERRDVVVPWVVGCDGLHSAVREAAGIDYPGAAIDAPWAVFDATIEGWQGDHDFVSVHLDVPPVILTPLPGRRWRAYLRPTSGTSDLVAETSEVIGRYQVGAEFVDVEKPTRFYCHSRIAARYRAGRILLAGDAAHVCTPAEGHGMNTGLQDAFNLAWKLALVCRGEAGAGLLDTYETERRPVAEIVVDVRCPHRGRARADRCRSASRARRRAPPHLRRPVHRAPRGRCHRRGRPRLPEVARRCRRRRRRVTPGRRVPDTGRVEPVDGRAQPLYQLAHRPGHTLVVLGGPDADPHHMQRLLGELEPLAGAVVEAIVPLSTHPSGPNVGRMDESVAAQLGVTGVTVLAVRPDRYVGLRDDRGDPVVVRALPRRCWSRSALTGGRPGRTTPARAT